MHLRICEPTSYPMLDLHPERDFKDACCSLDRPADRAIDQLIKRYGDTHLEREVLLAVLFAAVTRMGGVLSPHGFDRVLIALLNSPLDRSRRRA